MFPKRSLARCQHPGGIGTLPSQTAQHDSLTTSASSDQGKYTPISAEGYFAEALAVDVPTSAGVTSTFRVYYSPPTPTSSSSSSSSTPSSSHPPPPPSDGPATAPWARQNLAAGLGAGHSPTSNNGTVFVCIHGAGYSGLSWACFAKDVVAKGGGKVGALAFDARGHGAFARSLRISSGGGQRS